MNGAHWRPLLCFGLSVLACTRWNDLIRGLVRRLLYPIWWSQFIGSSPHSTHYDDGASHGSGVRLGFAAEETRAREWISSGNQNVTCLVPRSSSGSVSRGSRFRGTAKPSRTSTFLFVRRLSDTGLATEAPAAPYPPRRLQYR